MLHRRHLPQIEVVLLFLAGVVSGLALGLLFAGDRTGATLLAAVVVAIGTYRTIQVTREGQITERFTRAIEQLGSKEPDVRLGGIYTLERIARDSKVDHVPIMEVLTAYVRKRAPWPASSKARRRSGCWEPDNDVQAALAVIVRREVSHDKLDLDLSSTDLRGAKFGPDADFVRVNLEQAHLEGADLESAHHLESANLLGVSYVASGHHRTKWPHGFVPERRGAVRVPSCEEE